MNHAVVENDKVNILRNFSIYADHVLLVRWPDIVTIYKSLVTVTLVDVTIPVDKNISVKEDEKLTKYVYTKT